MIPIQDTVPARTPPLAVYVLVGLNVLVFALELSIPDQELERLFYLLGIVPARYTHPGWAEQIGFPADDYWPLLTSMFLHGGWAHIIGNMWTLWIFGDNVEDRMGPVRFALFYVVCGLAAAVVHWLTNPDSTVPTVGASGAIAGVMGAYFVLFPRAQVVVMVPILFFPLFFEVHAVVYLLFWALEPALHRDLGAGRARRGRRCCLVGSRRRFHDWDFAAPSFCPTTTSDPKMATR